MIFINGSFANNKDLSSQIGYIIALVNEVANVNNTFSVIRNVVYWSLTKYRQVTWSVLASKIYGMVNKFDFGAYVAKTLRIITSRLTFPTILVVVYTDSFSLYECLVKLSITKKKQLIVNIMALRQSYKRHKIIKIR